MNEPNIQAADQRDEDLAMQSKLNPGTLRTQHFPACTLDMDKAANRNVVTGETRDVWRVWRWDLDTCTVDGAWYLTEEEANATFDRLVREEEAK